MSLEREQRCPKCEAEVTFWRAGSTTLHLGEKVKWTCSECGYGFIEIDDISTATA